MNTQTINETRQGQPLVILTLEIKEEREVKINAEAERVRFKWAANSYSSKGVHYYTPGVYEVFIEVRQLRSLDFIDCSCIRAEISNCPKLKTISCQVNAIAELSIHECGELTALYCSSNCLTALDVSSVTNIRELHCEKNNGSLEGGLIVKTLSGIDLRVYRIKNPDPYTGVPDIGPESMAIHAKVSGHIVNIASADNEFKNGAVHSLSYTYQWMEL